jgi:hypothetical protein
MCFHKHSGILVDCYHDWIAMEYVPCCPDCGMRAEREPQYEWERPAWYWDVGDPARVARIMAAVRRGVSLSDASEIK